MARGVAVPTGGLNIRIVATGLLILMALVFVSAKYYQDMHPAIGFVRAFAEAAMVGGLADWFAVTALFRHPMGLPIPHTAIVPRNKDRIADTLARFLLTNFLLPRLIARKMQTVDVAGAVGKFLSQPAEGGGRLRLGASRIFADALGALDQKRLGGMVKSAIADRLRELDVAPLLGQALQAALAEGRHQPLLDAAVKWGSKTLDLNAELIHQMVHDNSNAIVRFTGLDETISNRIVAGLGKLLAEMAEDESHPLRLRVEDGLAKLALDLQHDPVVQQKVARVRDELLENRAVKRWLDGLWEQGRTALLKAARDPETMLAGRIGELMTQFGTMLGEDAAIKRTLNRYARRAVVGVVDSYGETALKLVSDTIRGWDAKTITDRLENAVGADLQYIRINGTLVGGLVGVAIHTVDVLI
ncbi:DUF445 domain-containing protein [Sphingopyxis sp. MWB1]|uniref:DUF445 domain-containing protein n=1 Tax=Sphingopyxis sp. MWB1 TaxID=1537715 RepID=UPI00068A0D08|nr:DUF445 domain-containing protein [Sphingopyxis sp. MWB1]